MSHTQLVTLSEKLSEVEWYWSSNDDPEQVRLGWRLAGREEVNGLQAIKFLLTSQMDEASVWLVDDLAAVRWVQDPMDCQGEEADMFRSMWFFSALGAVPAMAESTLLFEALRGEGSDHVWEITAEGKEKIGGATADVTRFSFSPRELDPWLEAVEFTMAVADFGSFQLMVEFSSRIEAKDGEGSFINWVIDKMVAR